MSVLKSMVARTGNTLGQRSSYISPEYSVVWATSLFGCCAQQVLKRPKLESMSEDLRPLVVKIPVKIMPPKGTETSQESLCIIWFSFNCFGLGLLVCICIQQVAIMFREMI